jgi:hypothetical protein
MLRGKEEEEEVRWEGRDAEKKKWGGRNGRDAEGGGRGWPRGSETGERSNT